MNRKPETLKNKLDNLPTEFPERDTTPSSARPARTAPGALGEFMAKESQVFAENKLLTIENAELKSAQVPRKLPPEVIVASQYANRSEDSFHGKEFEELLTEITNAGGNIQPIKVRPLKSEGPGPQRYEIVFGHRRHRACLISKNHVLVVVEELDDQSLFEQMDRENRSRADLRPYEQGLMYKRALDNGLFKNINQMCLKTGANQGNSSLVYRLANLSPDFLIGFLSPIDVQFRWIPRLLKAVDADPDLVLKRSKEIADSRRNGVVMTDAEVLAELTKATPANPRAKTNEVLIFNSTRATTAMLKKTKSGHILSFGTDVLTPDRESKLKRFIETLLN